MSARKLWVRVSQLPPDSATANLARAGDAEPQQDAEAPVKCLEDIPVAKSLREVGKFVQAAPDEFTRMAGDAS